MLTGEVKAGTIWCRSWTCEYCAPIRARQLMRDAINGEPNKFITLTWRAGHNEWGPDQAARHLVHAWRMTVQRGKREGIFTDIQYIAVFEKHQNGFPHLHILARCNFIAQAWLSKALEDYANAPRVDIRKIKGKKRAAFYIAKYTAKAPEKFHGCKRYWRTLGYDLSEGKADRPLHDHFKGYVTCDHISQVADLYQTHGYWLEWDNEHSFVAFPRDTDFWSHARDAWKRQHDPPTKEHRTCGYASKTTA
jgi:hypothetical protein